MGLLAPRVQVETKKVSARHAVLALGFALLTLNILDLLLTDLSMSTFGGTEVNPLMAPIVGTPWAVAAKLGIPVVVMALAMKVRSWHTVAFLRFAVAAYVLVAIVTLAQIAIVIR